MYERVYKNRAVLLSVGLVFGLFPVLSSATLLFPFRLDQSQPPGFGGAGTVTLDEATGGLADFFLLFTADGTIFDGVSTQPAEHVFQYGSADVIAAVGLIATATGLTGRIDLASKTSVSGAVQIGGFMNDGALSLDFTSGVASGFCFDNIGGAACVAGGGTSTSFDLRLTQVPEPPTLLLLGSAMLLVRRFAVARTSRASSPPRPDPATAGSARG
jgi:hypothetical protein